MTQLGRGLSPECFPLPPDLYKNISFVLSCPVWVMIFDFFSSILLAFEKKPKKTLVLCPQMKMSLISLIVNRSLPNSITVAATFTDESGVSLIECFLLRFIVIFAALGLNHCSLGSNKQRCDHW